MQSRLPRIISIVVFSPRVALSYSGGAARDVHRVGATGVLLMSVAYTWLIPPEALALLRESFRYGQRDLAWFRHMPTQGLGSTHDLPPQSRPTRPRPRRRPSTSK
jgi:hypothetical protein